MMSGHRTISVRAVKCLDGVVVVGAEGVGGCRLFAEGFQEAGGVVCKP